jgi:hypothetical protein
MKKKAFLKIKNLEPSLSLVYPIQQMNKKYKNFLRQVEKSKKLKFQDFKILENVEDVATLPLLIKRGIPM